eukprot:scaffold70393_cov17-Prasinocladus_malaysianus.AAC.1
MGHSSGVCRALAVPGSSTAAMAILIYGGRASRTINAVSVVLATAPILIRNRCGPTLGMAPVLTDLPNCFPTSSWMCPQQIIQSTQFSHPQAVCFPVLCCAGAGNNLCRGSCGAVQRPRPAERRLRLGEHSMYASR